MTRRFRAQPPWPLDLMVIGYLAVTALLASTLPANPLPMLHLVLVLGILLLRRVANTRLAPLHLLYAALLVPLLYGELDILSGLAGGQTYDIVVQNWEKSLFGDPMPAQWFSEVLPYLALSEWLHFCYLAYYPLLFLLPLRFYLLGRQEQLYSYLWSATAASFTIYFIQMWFPVFGPRPLMPPLDESIQGPCWYLCHLLAGHGASGAAAFPSGHVTTAALAATAAWNWDRKSYSIILPISVGMALATIYGRFHYTVDMLVGAFIGWLYIEFSPRFKHTVFQNEGHD